MVTRPSLFLPAAISFFFQAEDGIRDHCVTGVQTCALPISAKPPPFGIPVCVTVPVATSITSQKSGFDVRWRYRSEERRVGKESRRRGGAQKEKKKNEIEDADGQRMLDSEPARGGVAGVKVC